MAVDINRDQNVLQHILDYCRDIQDILFEINSERSIFDAKKVYRNGLALYVLQIGELTALLSDDFKKSHSNIPWRNIKAMSNIIAHKYGRFDFDILWEVVTIDIPTLKKFCETQILTTDHECEETMENF